MARFYPATSSRNLDSAEVLFTMRGTKPYSGMVNEQRGPEMTKPYTIDSPAKNEVLEPARNGLFLVKPVSKSHSIPAPEPRIAQRSRSLGLLALAAAALAAPLLWFLHEVLVSGR